MSLADKVKIARRFQRSIRIDVDAKSPSALEGFICPASSAEVLLQMSNHVSKGHSAFTWTGPYGSGKSSLAVALSAALNGNLQLRRQAANAIGPKVAERLWDALRPKKAGWKVVPVVGRRASPAQVIGDALKAHKLVKGRVTNWTNDQLLKEVSDISNDNPRSSGGLLVIVDEMGKLLEGAALDGEDIYLLQELAELASRSNGRFVIVGILHQAFDEYAQHLARIQRDEWAKIQGRFVDLAVNAVGDEQLDLLSRAIESKPPQKSPECEAVAQVIYPDRPDAASAIARTLKQCWPLHPLTACLLGPLSRRRFGQNQRSLFGFLGSAEPFGFQDFLQSADGAQQYTPNRLWDYLRANLEPAILASPDGHRWSTAVEEVDACEARNSTPLHVMLLKTIALVEMFKDRAGLSPTLPLLQTVATGTSGSEDVVQALSDLQDWSFIIHRRHAGTFAIYAGSDFDVNSAIDEILQTSPKIDYRELEQMAGLHPVVAKRHYHQTGALRWFNFGLTTVEQLSELDHDGNSDGSVGSFLLAIPGEEEAPEESSTACRDVVKSSIGNIIVGVPTSYAQVLHLAKEYIALQRIREERPELAGDAVARREVNARVADARARLEIDLRKMVDNCEWHRKWTSPTRYTYSELNTVASVIADKIYDSAPRFLNELLNRQQPSSNAVAAQKELLKRMVNYEGIERLGIKGFPPEGGLFESLLAESGLYRSTPNGWRFCSPDCNADPCNLTPLWDATTTLLRDAKDSYVSVDRLYEVWRRPPFGVATGLLPFLAVTFLLAEQRHLAFHRAGVFQPRFSDVDVDHLAMDPSSIQLRWMDLDQLSEDTLRGLGDAASALGMESLSNSDPLEVARQLVGIYVGLPSWTKRTNTLSKATRKLRDLFKQAADPNKFLFDDLPAVVEIDTGKSSKTQARNIIEQVTEGLRELTQAYPKMLDKLQASMLEELQLSHASPETLAELRGRAENIRNIGGDFRLTAFIGRMTRFDGSRGNMEDIASLAVSKPARDWVDTDLDQAKIELADFSRRFVRLEAFASVEGRPSKRESMAVILGLGRKRPMIKDFAITDSQRPLVDQVARVVESVLSTQDNQSSQVILAALARVSAKYMQAEH